MGVLLLGVTRAAACGGGSNGFEQEMGPLLFEQARSAQEFNGVIDPIFQEFSSAGNMATARAFAQRREETNRTHLNFVRIAAGWESLEPPAKAEAFHILALLMINFKLESLAHLVTVADSAAEIGQLNPILLSETSAQWAAALELWPKVLANTNSFDAADLKVKPNRRSTLVGAVTGLGLAVVVQQAGINPLALASGVWG